jgi:hypothetical protein
MLFGEITAVYSENHTKHINTLCGQNAELLIVQSGGTYTHQWVLNGYIGRIQYLLTKSASKLGTWTLVCIASHVIKYHLYCGCVRDAHNNRCNASDVA